MDTRTLRITQLSTDIQLPELVAIFSQYGTIMRYERVCAEVALIEYQNIAQAQKARDATHKQYVSMPWKFGVLSWEDAPPTVSAIQQGNHIPTQPSQQRWDNQTWYQRRQQKLQDQQRRKNQRRKQNKRREQVQRSQGRPQVGAHMDRGGTERRDFKSRDPTQSPHVRDYFCSRSEPNQGSAVSAHIIENIRKLFRDTPPVESRIDVTGTRVNNEPQA